MKRLLLPALLLLLGGTLLTSCNKDYDCYCTYTDSGSLDTKAYDINVSEKNHAKAEEKCNEVGNIMIQQGYADVDCKITN